MSAAPNPDSFDLPADHLPAGEPWPATEEPEEGLNGQLPDADDARWDAFLADDDERDPVPEPGDFWIDDASFES